MPSPRIFDATEHRDEWRAVVAVLPPAVRDIYFDPDYVALHLTSAARALLYVYEDAGLIWAYPFLLTPISGFERARGWSDLQAPYGYGGPVANTDDPVFLDRAHASFREWCREHRVLAEFVRFHPLVGTDRWADASVERVLDRQTFSLDLSRLTDGSCPFKKPARNVLQRARRLGVVVLTGSSDADFARFLAAYFRSMDRLNAAPDLYFSTSYFEGLQRMLSGGRGRLLIAESEGTWLAAAAFLKGEAYLHYHLCATIAAALVPGAVNLLIETAAREAAQQGLSLLHLGGGRSTESDDSLARFKKSMSTTSHNYVVGRRVFDQATYLALYDEWSRQYPHLAGRFGGRVLFYRHTDQSVAASPPSLTEVHH